MDGQLAANVAPLAGALGAIGVTGAREVSGAMGVLADPYRSSEATAGEVGGTVLVSALDCDGADAGGAWRPVEYRVALDRSTDQPTCRARAAMVVKLGRPALRS